MNIDDENSENNSGVENQELGQQVSFSGTEHDTENSDSEPENEDELTDSGDGTNANEEKKRAKFVELAEKRTTAAINALRRVGNLSNRNNYIYDQYQVDQLLSAIDKEVEKIKQQFSIEKENETVQFKFITIKS